MESTFTDAEKVRSRAVSLALHYGSLTVSAAQRIVLAEMIKVSQVDVGVLVDFILSHEVQPNWMYMQLPGGMPRPDFHARCSSPARTSDLLF